MNFSIIAALLLAASVGGGWAGHRLTQMHYEHEIDVQRNEAQQKLDALNVRADAAAADFESWKAQQRPKTITITREVQRAVQNDPDCSQRGLPDGLRDALIRAGAAAGQPIAAQPLPAASAASAGNVG